MTKIIESQIIDAEERLKQAMLASDVSVLDKLLAPEIIITNHFGQLMSKEDDLGAHKSGLIKIHELNPFGTTNTNSGRGGDRVCPYANSGYL